MISTDVHLLGALLRLKECHNAHLELILPDSVVQHLPWVEPEWLSVVGVDRKWTASDWMPVLGVFWRGYIDYTRPKVYSILWVLVGLSYARCSVIKAIRLD